MRLIIVGTGVMGKNQLDHFARIDGVEVVAAVDSDATRLATFADRFNIKTRFTSLDEAIAWGEFDAATNVTPDRMHHPTTLALLAAGKHVLCEKPLAENYEKALEMTEAAERAGVINMVNLTYRNVAPLQRAREMVIAGEIGTVKHVEASYLQSWLVSKAWGDWRSESTWLWRLSTGHGSNGVLGDIGIHILDFAAYGAATDIDHVFARLKTFNKAPGGQIGEYRLDANDSFAMSVDFANGALGVVHATRWATGHLNELKLRVYGERGGLEVIHRPDGSELRVCTGDDVETAEWKVVDVPSVLTNYQRFVEAVRTGVPQDPNFRHAANLQKVLDLALVTELERRELKV
ncbi:MULTISPECIES: Gfo/Idh/MocA family protein [unclassified Rhizobium]|uniref:Gfo/Idh/MocA family protein n=1 Tax=unclassified Rhizobium TaxID=2613769 RepID=UPI001ADC9969|nr:MULTISPECIES: Gfo/Idh/MocA family oxidoreductase [unclassified Rhizobium]MBO9099167.1 Gfo/Idh/MocA family oxidoreductase [Rhizobium sp. L58/93]MBO9132027.1 Gfo/Idh/MocA family oxidoreductase [Rhizobium sp. B209b/85]MBO9169429.1 Gfo/Idh/MocA family oxidoreductase [Rhizobium sp. L245/93]MBO9185380.1 Gfo/Idh/MocA family oxidoreductase [Rhizobium sp. E27B/91]QXZ85518.1 Gfo/Idh/MocA family oxidoreductase [Rhizobium sp. K1/93]